MRPLFMSYSGHRSGIFSHGWCVIDCSPVVTGLDVEKLTRIVEQMQGYDANSLCINNFRRLEDQ